LLQGDFASFNISKDCLKSRSEELSVEDSKSSGVLSCGESNIFEERQSRSFCNDPEIQFLYDLAFLLEIFVEKLLVI
jgi:hypothetical protein